MLRQSLLRRAAAVSRPFTIQTAYTLPSFCRRLATSPSTFPSSIPADLPPTSSSQSATASSPASRPPYLVSRTPSLFLPVYQDTKRGGNKKLTILKKIQGDARVLKEDLRTELGLEEGQIRINHVTGHIEIVGFRKDDVVSYLTKQGF
ncbi:mitochondrial large subunit ribosomal protein-domain-containing protein [Coniochaeta sp. 2T2.1]|nr:mitochondrial large subunit ribosomal protein-domain-containing protein [Coniochaeta sp. 2T2.1]